MLGTRDAANLSEWQAGDSRDASIGSFSDAAAFGDIIVLATKGIAAGAALELAGTDNLIGKTVIDATNPIKDEPPVNGVLKFFTTFEESLMEQLQKAVPAANFVKAFNSIGSALMINPSFASKPTMFICGNDEDTKKEVTEILDLFGWETADFGMVESARAIEPLCMLWCIPGMVKNEWTRAFKLLTK